VQWTLADPLVDNALLQRDGPAALRRFRLQRLLREAAAQGAAPTNDDLATALKVSRRTIQRDLKALDLDP
jgi:predicted DNA-binding transcriptional regulator YafY